MTMTNKIILIDMDGVLADFERGFLEAYTAKYPQRESISLENRTTFYIREQYPKQYAKDVEAIYLAPGFIRNLPPIPGTIKALQEMQELKLNAFICTSSLYPHDHCVGEKYDWVLHHLGNYWVKRIIVTKDKTLVRGDYLIDDKPKHTGLLTPTWEHIYYDAPYNRAITSRRRLTWDNWKSIIL